jgi:hypothetical protein
MEELSLLALVVRLGREFSRRGMREECRRLRLYYLALEHGLCVGKNRIDVAWDEGLVVEWLRILRVPPHDRHYPVRSSTLCAGCEHRAGTVVTKLVFPGGARMECLQCGARWIRSG